MIKDSQLAQKLIVYLSLPYFVFQLYRKKSATYYYTGLNVIKLVSNFPHLLRWRDKLNAGWIHLCIKTIINHFPATLNSKETDPGHNLGNLKFILCVYFDETNG